MYAIVLKLVPMVDLNIIGAVLIFNFSVCGVRYFVLAVVLKKKLGFFWFVVF